MSTSDTAPVVRADRAFLGHPAGLAWLSGTEFWERFSYYGMLTLLNLYMVHQLLLPGHVEHIWGFPVFRRFVEGLYGARTPQELAAGIVGLYSATVYLTPLAGGALADRLLGRTRTVALGASLMALGHFLMAFDASFLLALTCLLLGTGCFKGNIATQVGDLYPRGDLRRADAFQIYLFGIQVAVIISPIVCGRLAQDIAWHWGFGAAGVGMLIGLVIYLSGRPWLPPEAPRQRASATPVEKTPLTSAQWQSVAVLVGILPVMAVAIIGNQEIFNAYLVWGEANYQLTVFGMTMPITDILSYGSIVSATTIVLAVAFWRWWATRWTEPDELTKIAIGVALSALGPLLLAAASALIAANHQKASLGWALAFEFVNDLGFANVFPVGLALYSRAAPKGLTGMIIGIYYLHLFAGNLLVGWLGGLLETMPATTFWLMHSVLLFGSVVALLVIRFTAGNRLAPAYSEADMAIERA